MSKLDRLEAALVEVAGNIYSNLYRHYNEITIEVSPDRLIELMNKLALNDKLSFEQCQDVCGVDYLSYKNEEKSEDALRFAVVYHLLSQKYNWRLRVKTFATNNEFPIVPSVVDIWSSVNWFERETFDLYGIVFEGHPDLRRILTDYGFIGHPFRKDFPLSGYVEMRYDEEQKRVIYQPVTIEPREITPRIIREEGYGGRN
ncbi:NADH-quinone oxidoreductase subunit C [Aquella oligotrophica]|uniref:NADH-quinone oxidoreductase subunit C n=1 Tax=Aquella oligotrophica TaxID=2067065 RepID=A0A2I7N4J1_9NEIS|nr:NADH-quinone oxidoreductase subunit C [Aquella oligotrophica]AUR51382.1 NADH-quinone oxidoreductase subunit C [Aquella oligotrophica]